VKKERKSKVGGRRKEVAEYGEEVEGRT